MKLSKTIPVNVLLHAPHTLSTLKGENLKPHMVIAFPCIKNYFQQVEALVNSGEIIRVTDTYYLAPSKQSPRIARLPSLEIEHDITLTQLHALHLPTEEEATHD